MLTMRVTPKMSDRPAARKKREAAFARPFKAWSANTSRGSLFPRAQLPHDVVGRLHGGAVDVLEVDHRAFAVLYGGLADPRAHRALMVDRAVGDRPGGRIYLEAGERGDQLVGISAARLGDASRERLDGDVADERTQPRIVVVTLLIRAHERFVLRSIDLVPRVAGDDPALRRLVLQRIEILRLAREQAHHRLAFEKPARLTLAHEAREIR